MPKLNNCIVGYVKLRYFFKLLQQIPTDLNVCWRDATLDQELLNNANNIYMT